MLSLFRLAYAEGGPDGETQPRQNRQAAADRRGIGEQFAPEIDPGDQIRGEERDAGLQREGGGPQAAGVRGLGAGKGRQGKARGGVNNQELTGGRKQGAGVDMRRRRRQGDARCSFQSRYEGDQHRNTHILALTILILTGSR